MTRRTTVETEKSGSKSESNECGEVSVGLGTAKVSLSLELKFQQGGWWGLSW